VENTGKSVKKIRAKAAAVLCCTVEEKIFHTVKNLFGVVEN